MERFIFVAFPVAQLFWLKTGEPASLRSDHINPEPSSMLRGQRKLFRISSLAGCSTNPVVTAAPRLSALDGKPVLPLVLFWRPSPSFARRDSRGRLSLRDSW